MPFALIAAFSVYKCGGLLPLLGLNHRRGWAMTLIGRGTSPQKSAKPAAPVMAVRYVIEGVDSPAAADPLRVIPSRSWSVH